MGIGRNLERALRSKANAMVRSRVHMATLMPESGFHGRAWSPTKLWWTMVQVLVLPVSSLLTRPWIPPQKSTSFTRPSRSVWPILSQLQPQLQLQPHLLLQDLWTLVQQSAKEILTSARTINVWPQLEESLRISVKQCAGLNWSDFTNLACQCFGSAGELIFWASGSLN